MAWDDVLALIGGAAGGIVDNDRGAEKNQLALAKLQQQAEVARLRGEIQMMVASMNEGGRNSRFDKGEAGRTGGSRPPKRAGTIGSSGPRTVRIGGSTPARRRTTSTSTPIRTAYGPTCSPTTRPAAAGRI
jgi:hypothetical protein